MKFSPILKGLIISAALFMFVSEAAAQLPVRTRNLVMLSTLSGQITQNAGAAAVASYSVTWPASASIVLPNHRSFLYATAGSTATQQDLGWFDVTGDLVDNNTGTALPGQVTYWLDNNTIVGEADFLWDDATNTLTIGGAGAGGAADLVFSVGAAATAGTVNTAALATPHVYTLPNVSTAVEALTLNIPVATNLPPSVAGPGNEDQILMSNLDGSATWTVNPFFAVERGLFDPIDGGFTATILVTGTPDNANDVLIVSSNDVGGTNGNILTVTAVNAGNFIVTSSGPFTASERISWLFIPVP